MSNNGNGVAAKWVFDHANYEHDYCLLWPFCRTRGYGQFQYRGKRYYAHRFMCELRNGPPPSPSHEAAHSCGRGHEGCVNPKHLTWKTQSENQLDAYAAGYRVRNPYGTQGRISLGEAQQIRLMKGIKLQREVAEEFGVSESTISDIWLGRTHTRLSKVNYWSPEDDEKLRDAIAKNYSFRQAAELLGRAQAGVSSRAYRLGLKSGWDGPGGISLEQRAVNRADTTAPKAGDGT